ncbi:cytochrome P450 [bacterium]|nr:cytochrome P450 [bacterium]
MPEKTPLNQNPMETASPLPGSKGEHLLQQRYGTGRRAKSFYYKQVLDRVNDSMVEFISRQDLVFIATADASGECDCSFRAGAKGFVKVLNEKVLVYPEYRGNGVMASLGNIFENPNLGLYFIDYEDTIGLHVNGHASILENSELAALPHLPEEIRQELNKQGRSAPERWVRIDVQEAYIHCSKHIPRMQKVARDIDWGTDSIQAKAGDYFQAKYLARPWQPVALPAAARRKPTPCNGNRFYDLVSAEAAADPFPTYHAMREKDPVYWSEQLGVWALTRYEDCKSVLRDPRFKANRMTQLLQLKYSENCLHKSSIYYEYTDNAIMWMDGEPHRACRAPVEEGMRSERLAGYEKKLHLLADEMLDSVIASGRLDLAVDFADQFPRNMILRICDLPREDKFYLEDCTADIVHFFLGPRPQRTIDHIISGLHRLLDYTRLKVSERRTHPGQDLISHLISAERPGVSSRQLEFQIATLLIGAFAPTTPGMLGPGILAFLENPEQLAKLRSNPGLLDNAVEEALRYNASNQYTYRIATEEVEIAGKTIPKGSALALFLGAANRDPAVFENPDRFDIERKNSRQHLSFSFGAHYCVAAGLARSEGRAVFSRLFERLPNLRLDGPPLWNEYLEFRTLWSLPVRWDPIAPV